jgi:5-(carboxyamino)imidazole ribonucleotide mutase
MCAQLPGAIPYIEQTRNASGNRRREEPHSKPFDVPFQQDPQDDNHLKHCSHFANHPRTNFHFTDRHLNDDHASEDQNVAANDGPREPEWDGLQPLMFETQNDNAGDEQQFVSEWIQNCTEFTPLVVAASDVAIDAIANSRDCKGKNCRQTMSFVAVLNVIEHFDDEEWNQEDSENGDFIRRRHACGQSWAGQQNVNHLTAVANYAQRNRPGCETEKINHRDTEAQRAIRFSLLCVSVPLWFDSEIPQLFVSFLRRVWQTMRMSKSSSSKALVGILMGSDTDWPTMKAAADACAEFEIPCDVRVISAHRTPQDLAEYASGAHKRGMRVIIAGAGGAAHLPGVTAAFTPLPVIGVPIESKALRGLDSLLSIVQMPSGIPVATVAIGGGRNAGLLAVQILAVADPALQKKVLAFKARLAQESRAKNKNLAIGQN